MEEREARSGTGARRNRSWAAALLVAALCAATLATAASAHHGEPATGESEPGEFGEESGLTGATGISTDNEGNLPVGGPVAKPGEQAGWQQIAGSKWTQDENGEPVITEMAEPNGEPSPTPYDLDFYGLGFPKAEVAESAGLSHAAAQAAAKSNGFAVGAQCRRDPSNPSQPVAPEATADCDRIPVIYRYYEHPTRGLIWEESSRGSDATDPGGFAAAVAWLGPDRALAVGGTGIYPRVGAAEAAGAARAWLFEDGFWRELSDLPDPPGGFTGEGGDEIPDEMGALTAMDASPRPFDCGADVKRECAVAGGLAQLWHFADGRFFQGYGPGLANSGPVTDASAFNSRVRDIRFFPNWRFINGGAGFGQRRPERLPPGTPARVHAVASAGLYLDASGWHANAGVSGHSLTVLRTRWENWGAFPGTRVGSAPADCIQSDDPRPECDFFRVSAARTAHLVSADGDIKRYCDEGANTCGNGQENWPDTIADWAVGVLRSSGRGIAYTTATRDNHAGVFNAASPLAKPSQCSGDEELIPDSGVGTGPLSAAGLNSGDKGLCSPEAYQRKNASKALYALPSYALNAYRVAGEDIVAGDEGTGWAVGDHGAILTRGGAVAAGEAEPARRGAKSEPAPVPRPDAFDQHRPPVTDEPGAVPALAAQPRAESSEPGFAEAQTVGQAGSLSQGPKYIVMSRDGSEGWALGADIYRYDGMRWAPCDPVGVPGLLPPDRACAALASLGRSPTPEAPETEKVKAVARVPLEHDSDPTNDDEFKAAALTNGGLYRYHEGRWSRDEDAFYERFQSRKEIQGSIAAGTPDGMVFTAPDDGWIATSGGQTSGLNKIGSVFHFDGERWWDCVTSSVTINPPAACGDENARLRVIFPRQEAGSGAMGLTAAGERVYFFSFRDAAPHVSGECNNSAGVCAIEPYPVILYHDRGGAWQGGDDDTDPDTDDDPDPDDGVFYDDGTYNPADGGWDPGCVAKVEDPSPFVGEKCEATGRGADQGRPLSLAVAQDADGSFQGWAVGTFGGIDPESAPAVMMRLDDGGEGCLAASACWRPWTVPDAANDYLRLAPKFRLSSVRPGQQLTLPSQAGSQNAFLLTSFPVYTTAAGTGHSTPPALAFDREQGERGRWEAIPTPWSVSSVNRDLKYPVGIVSAIAGDQQGGFWAAVTPQEGGDFSFRHYTDRPPQPVFEETPDPAGDAEITAIAAGADGTLWLGDANGAVYRYDRLAGWSGRIEIPGWDPKVVTKRAGVAGIAAGPDGEGIAVGPGGRIATLGEEVRLDPAATVGCENEPVPPCGTGNDLLAASVAPDGSAIVAGKSRALLWRPAGGGFTRIAGPPVPLATAITEVSMPAPERAYLLTDKSHVIRGEMSSPGRWSWQMEVGSPEGGPDPLIASGRTGNQILPIEDVAVDASGHGYAVGVGGLVLERTGGGELWHRIPSGYLNDLQAVALPAGGGEGALVGGEGGLILTLIGGRLEVARDADSFDPVIASNQANPVFASTDRNIDLALTPGYRAGEVEAWALRRAYPAMRNPPPHALLHYPADPADPRLDPARGLTALPDAPAPEPGEISFAAFGKQDCDATNRDFRRGAGNFAARDTCGPPDDSNITAGLINRRIREELAARSAGEGTPQFTIFTGDGIDKPGGRETLGGSLSIFAGSNQVKTPFDLNLKHRRWVELVANSLAEQGLPMFGAIGAQDLARNVEGCSPPGTDVFFGGCINPQQAGAEQLGAQPGLNLPWRAAMAFTPAPWEGKQEAGGLRFEPVEGGALSQAGPEGETPPLTSPQAAIPALLFDPRARAESYPSGSGDTHYATDVIDDSQGGEKLARIVVVDTSLRSLAASDPQQHPIEAGGQLRWLEEMLCVKTVEADPICTREPGQQAIVVSNTPTYSYGPISPEELQTDAAVFESVLLKNQVNVVVSGRLGWQGRYWALAPGVHSPCPGQGYRPDSDPPSLTDAEVCGAGAAEGADPSQLEQLPEDAKDATGLASSSAIPFVVSSSAGGHFNTGAESGGFATAKAGFWRGYSIVRLSPDGDPAKTIVEQRPILDWVGLSTSDPVVEPRRTLKLQSLAREAFGMDTLPRYYPIDFKGITHRYDLLLADPENPAAACMASDAGCVALRDKLAAGPRSLGSARDDSGGASASGSGSAQDDNSSLSSRAEASRSDAAAEGSGALAAAQAGGGACDPYLCLPERVGTIDSTTGEVKGGNGKYPDTFALALLSVGDHVAAQPLVFTRSPSFIVNPLRLAPGAPLATANATGNPNVPNPPQVPQPNFPQSSAPEPPAIPGTPPLAAATPPELQPPAPPSPPPPSQQPSPLDLTVSPQAIAIATPTAVIQPPTPPVNPAPPGGARREARQRQAAAQKSGADSDKHEIQEGGGDLAQGGDQVGGSAAMTRHARTRPEPSFTAVARPNQPSAWATGALYTGGITLMSLALALTWTRGRPTPRRRQPEVPAPARAWARRR